MSLHLPITIHTTTSTTTMTTNHPTLTTHTTTTNPTLTTTNTTLHQPTLAKRQPLQFPWVSLYAGATAGIISTALLQPFDVAKTTMINPAYHHHSMTSLWRSVVTNEGAAGLWRGLAPALVRITLGSSVYFTTQTYLLHLIQRNQALGDTIKSTQWLSVGAIARSVAVTVACPISVVKTRFEGSSRAEKQYTGVIHAIRSIIREEGLIRGLWAGVLPSVVKDAPYSGVYLLMYTRCKELLGGTGGRNTQSHDITVQFISGFTAGGLATVLFQPLEVLKTRRQLTPKVSLWQCAQLIQNERGLTGFYRGSVPRVLRRSFSNALSWMIFEQISGFYRTFTGL